MREILFRGKAEDNTWCYGDLTHILGKVFIDGYLPINPETVGQYTGIKDKNGVKIFEGDIIRHSKSGRKFLVAWDECSYCTFENGDIKLPYFEILRKSEKHEVIGNIHDDPQLLEKRK